MSNGLTVLGIIFCFGIVMWIIFDIHWQNEAMKNNMYLFEIKDLENFEFHFDNYATEEVEILNPVLERAGYVVQGKWKTLEGDSFGPLVRGVITKNPLGELALVWYG